MEIYPGWTFVTLFVYVLYLNRALSDILQDTVGFV